MRGQQPVPDASSTRKPAIVEVSGVSKRFGTSQALSERLHARLMPVRRFCARWSVEMAPANRRWSACLPASISPDANGRVQFGGEEAPGIAERQKWRLTASPVSTKNPRWVPTLTVAENLLHERTTYWRPRLDPLGARCGGMPSAYSHAGVWNSSVEQECARLTVEQRQIVEIARRR